MAIQLLSADTLRNNGSNVVLICVCGWEFSSTAYWKPVLRKTDITVFMCQNEHAFGIIFLLHKLEAGF